MKHFINMSVLLNLGSLSIYNIFGLHIVILKFGTLKWKVRIQHEKKNSNLISNVCNCVLVKIPHSTCYD